MAESVEKMFIYRKSFKHIISNDNTVWLLESYYSNKKDTNHIIEYLYAINHIWLFQKLNHAIYVNFLGLFFTYLFDMQYVPESFRRFSTQLLTKIKSSKENFQNWINIIANYYLGVHRWTWRIWRPLYTKNWVWVYSNAVRRGRHICQCSSEKLHYCNKQLILK